MPPKLQERRSRYLANCALVGTAEGDLGDRWFEEGGGPVLSDKPFEDPKDLLALVGSKEPRVAAIAGAESGVALDSARKAQDAGLIVPLLVGDKAKIKDAADKLDWDLAGLSIVNTETEVDTAQKAVALAREGEAAVLMKGGIHTDALMRAVVNRDTGLRTGRRMSHIFRMSFPGSDQTFCITDAALNVAPDVDARLHILRNAVDLLHDLGVENPKVAVLSAVETPSQAMPSSLEAAEIAKRAADGEVDGAIVEGPLSFDLAISPKAVEIKGIESRVAGAADLVVVPNIETGNSLFKSLVYFSSATAAGLVVGAAVPIVLTSRADPPQARLAATAMAVASVSD